MAYLITEQIKTEQVKKMSEISAGDSNDNTASDYLAFNTELIIFP